MAVTGSQLAGSWRLFQRESENEQGLGIEVVAEGADCCGEFSNHGGIYNGSFYIRYTTQFDGDYDDDEETILVIKQK